MELLILVAVFVGIVSGLEINDRCTTPRNEPGICVPVKECDHALKLVRSGTYEDMLYLQKTVCGVDKVRKPLTCCPAQSEDAGKMLNPENCGRVMLKSRIIGGEPAKLEEFPWSALLIYNVSRNGTSGFLLKASCGGSLITTRHVLTAAHCIHTRRTNTLTFVRFGEHNMSNPETCTIINDVEICRKDYEIDAIKMHSGYNRDQKSFANDIALLTLSEDVAYSKFVCPVCLPFDDTIKDLQIDGEEFTVTGWGRTEMTARSDILLQVDLMGNSPSVCNSVYNRTLVDTQLCVGGDEGKDSCKGDSGGPLLWQEEGVWYQVGVVSFGNRFCGMGGYPGIYTDVTKYLRWIEQAVNETI